MTSLLVSATRPPLLTGCKCVRPRLAGPQVPDVQDAGHGAPRPPLPHTDPAGVTQHRPRPAPGHRARRIRPHAATQTQIGSSEANNNFLISARCLFTLWIPLRLDNLDRVRLLMFEDGRTREVQQIQRGPGPVSELGWRCNNGRVMSLQYSGDNECKCDDSVGRMSGIIVTDISSHNRISDYHHPDLSTPGRWTEGWNRAPATRK